MQPASSGIPDWSWDLKTWKISLEAAGTFAKLVGNFPSIPSSESRVIRSRTKGVNNHMRNQQPLKQILSATRDHWDRPETRPAVRQNFARTIDCRTPALGAEVYASLRLRRHRPLLWAPKSMPPKPK